MNFKLVSKFTPQGDQPQAIQDLLKGLRAGKPWQVLLGVTGSGKTYAMAKVVEEWNRPTLVLSHNKTLAAQLYSEFKSFFPENAVEYFVSYYDYYQPEAYVPQSDTYIEKETDINDEIEKLRIRATQALFDRRDVLIVASVSCIYGIGDPQSFFAMLLPFSIGLEIAMKDVLMQLVQMQYERTQYDLYRGSFRLRGDTLEIFPAHEDFSYRIEFFGDRVEKIQAYDPVRGKKLSDVDQFTLFPATHFAAPQERLRRARDVIREELRERIAYYKSVEKPLEAERIEQRTNYDLEMMEQMGYCSGIENYSRHISARAAGEPPATLIDYFPKDFLLIVDESHQSLPQVRGMQHGDRSRKQTLVDFGFRLPSALDNRPLTFDEFLSKVNQAVCVSATPGPFEMEKTGGVTAEQIIRPTGLLDPEVEIRPTKGQVQDLEKTIKEIVGNGERVLVTTLTKRMAEDLTQHYTDLGIKCRYLHSDIDTLERIAILTAFRKGEFDVLIGINLLREGLDLPEVSMVAILDADQEGFLRSDTSLIQTAGRAARNVHGRVVLYADRITRSMKAMMDETARRRKTQAAYNRKHGIVPETIIKDISNELVLMGNLDYFEYKPMDKAAITDELTLLQAIKRLEREMKEAAKAWDFEKAAKLRDELTELKKTQIFT